MDVWMVVQESNVGSTAMSWTYLRCWPKNSWLLKMFKGVLENESWVLRNSFRSDFGKSNMCLWKAKEGFHESKYGPGSIPLTRIYQVYKGPKYGCYITVYYVHYRIVVSRHFWGHATATPHQGVSNRRAWARVDYLRSSLGCFWKISCVNHMVRWNQTRTTWNRPPKIYHDNGNTSIWRCTGVSQLWKKWWFSIAMLVFGVDFNLNRSNEPSEVDMAKQVVHPRN